MGQGYRKALRLMRMAEKFGRQAEALKRMTESIPPALARALRAFGDGLVSCRHSTILKGPVPTALVVASGLCMVTGSPMGQPSEA
jgi:hypothetical protein